jgi:hypothetical protein
MLAQLFSTVFARSVVTEARGTPSSVAAKKSARRADQNAATAVETDPALARTKGISMFSSDEFIAREIKRYRDAVALCEDEANSSDAQQRAFARQSLPQLQQQLAMLESLKTADDHHRDVPAGRRS